MGCRATIEPNTVGLSLRLGPGDREFESRPTSRSPRGRNLWRPAPGGAARPRTRPQTAPRTYTRRTMGGLATQLLVGAAGGLVAAAFASVLTYRGIVRGLDHARESDRLADARRLRDARRERLVASIELVLHASLTVGQVVSDARRIWQTETVEARDARHTAMLEQAWVGLNEARVSLMIQSVTKEFIRIVDEDVLMVFVRYRSAYEFDQKFPDTDAHKDLDTESKLLDAGVEKLRVEAVRVLDDMETPIPEPPAKVYGNRTLRGDGRKWLGRLTEYLTGD